MSTPIRVSETVEAHYTRPDLGGAILAALEQAGKDLDRLTPEDLAPIDEFHIRGRVATLELARAANLDLLVGTHPRGQGDLHTLDEHPIRRSQILEDQFVAFAQV